MNKRVKRGQIQTRCWWALVRGPHRLPVLFATRQQALENADLDERVVRVYVMAYSASHQANAGITRFRD